MQNNKEQNTNNINRYPDTTARIRQLNDHLRTTHTGGRIMLSAGMRALDGATINQIIQSIAQFSDFNERNDPYGEHDCAIIKVEDVNVLWKIDYYDETLTLHSPDPTDDNVTLRILTVMLADEY